MVWPMTQFEIIGYLAGLCLLAMAASKTQAQMRAFNIAACLLYVAYGFGLGLMPVLIINAVMIGLHIYRLSQLWRQRETTA
jgi:hypothetical protein